MKKLMMKFMLAVSVLMGLGMFAACDTTGQLVTNASFNNTAAQVERGVLSVQTTATALLRAKVITVEQDQLIQKQVDLVHNGVMLAKALQSSNPTQAALQITSLKEQIDALKKQTGAPS